MTDRLITAQQVAERLVAREDIVADVTADDVRVLTGRGDLTIVEHDEHSALYSCAQLDQLDTARVVDVVDERENWIADSHSIQQAAQLLGWEENEVQAVAEHFEIIGRFGRIASDNVARLAMP